MSSHALVRISSNTFEKHAEFEAVPPQPNPVKDYKWLPLIITKPAFDPVNQIQEGPVTVVGANDVTMTWTNRAKTAPELAVEKQAEDTSVKRMRFTASVTIGAIAAATFTDKTFTIPGLLTTDTIMNVTFPAGLLPATISYVPLRVSAANTLSIRFMKIATGAVTPPAPQTLDVLVAR